MEYEHETPIKAYVCRFCKGSFDQLENLQKHVQKIHTPISSSKENRTCPLCGSMCLKYDVYRNHLLHIHGLNEDGQVIAFRSFNDFLYWKNELEKRHYCKYIGQKVSKKLLSSNKKVHIYKCDSSFSKTKEKKGTFTATAPCPSIISAIESIKTRDIKVEYWSTHVGHIVPPESEEIEAALSSLERTDIYNEDSRYQTISQDSEGNIMFSSESNDGYSHEVVAKEVTKAAVSKAAHSLFQSIINNSPPKPSSSASPKRFSFKKDPSKKPAFPSYSLASVACMKSKKPPPPPEPLVMIPLETAVASEAETAVQSVVDESTPMDTSISMPVLAEDSSFTMSETSNSVTLDVNNESTPLPDSAILQEGANSESVTYTENIADPVILQEETNSESVSLQENIPDPAESQEYNNAESAALQEQTVVASVASTSNSTILPSGAQGLITPSPDVSLPTVSVNQYSIANLSSGQVLASSPLPTSNALTPSRSLLTPKPRTILPKDGIRAKKSFTKASETVIEDGSSNENEMVIDSVEAAKKEAEPPSGKDVPMPQKVVTTSGVDVTAGSSVSKAVKSSKKSTPKKGKKALLNSLIGKTMPLPGGLPPNSRIIRIDDPNQMPLSQILSSLPPGRAFIPINGSLVPVNTPTSSIITSNTGFLMPHSALSTSTAQSIVAHSPVTPKPTSILISDVKTLNQNSSAIFSTPNIVATDQTATDGPIIFLQNAANSIIPTTGIIPTISRPIVSSNTRSLLTMQPGVLPQNLPISLGTNGTSLLLSPSTSLPFPNMLPLTSTPLQSASKPIVTTTVSNTIQVQKVKLPFSSSVANSIRSSIKDSTPLSSTVSSKKSRKRVQKSSPFTTNISSPAVNASFLNSLPITSVPSNILGTKVNTALNTLPISSTPTISIPSKPDQAGTLFFESGGDIYVLQPVEDALQSKINGVVEKETGTKTTVDKKLTNITLDDDTKIMPLIRANRGVSSLKSMNEKTSTVKVVSQSEENETTVDDIGMDTSFDFQEKDVSLLSATDNETKIETKVVSPSKAGIQIKSIVQQKRTHKEEDADVLKKVKYYQLEMKYLSSQAECKRLKLELAKAERKNKEMDGREESAPSSGEHLFPLKKTNFPIKLNAEDSDDNDDITVDHPMDYDDDDSEDDNKIREATQINTTKEDNKKVVGIAKYKATNKHHTSSKEITLNKMEDNLNKDEIANAEKNVTVKPSDTFDDLFMLANTKENGKIITDDGHSTNKQHCDENKLVDPTAAKENSVSSSKLEKVTLTGLDKLTRPKGLNQLQTVHSNGIEERISNEQSMDIEFCDENQFSTKAITEWETKYGNQPLDIYTMVRTSVLRNLYTDLKGLCQENKKLFEELQKHRPQFKVDEIVNADESEGIPDQIELGEMSDQLEPEVMLEEIESEDMSSQMELEELTEL